MKIIRTKFAQTLQSGPGIDINEDQTYQLSINNTNSMTLLVHGKVAENFEFHLRAELEAIAVIRGNGKEGVSVSLTRLGTNSHNKETEGNPKKIFELYLPNENGLSKRVRERVLSVKQDVERTI